MPIGAGELDVTARDWSAPKGDKAAITATWLNVAAMQAHERAWRDLAESGPDANPFLHPGCLMPAIRHLGVAPAPVFCAAFLGPPARQRLIGLLPIRPPRIRMGLRLVRTWTHPFLTSGEPLLHPDHGAEALPAMIAALRTGALAARALLWRDLLPGGRTVQMLRIGANRGQHGIDVKAPRATEAPADVSWLAHPIGNVSTLPEVRAAVERFLVLDAARLPAGSSLLSNPGHTAFLRAMSREMARAGLFRIEERWDGERLLASNILLGPADRPIPWRVAVDAEALGAEAQLPIPCARHRADAVVSFSGLAADGGFTHALQKGLRWRLEAATLQAIVKFLPIG